MILTFVLACEVAFWVVLFGGLAMRYLLQLPRLGAGLLITVPLIDLALLVATAIDLRGGASARWEHGLAAIYLAVSLVYGHRMMRWADVRFAHRFGGGPPPSPTPRYGLEHAALQRRNWLRHLLAWAVGCALLLAAIGFVGDPDRSQELWSWIGRWSLILGIDFLWSFSYTLWPRRRGGTQPERPAAGAGSDRPDPGLDPEEDGNPTADRPGAERVESLNRSRAAGRRGPTAAGTPR